MQPSRRRQRGSFVTIGFLILTLGCRSAPVDTGPSAAELLSIQARGAELGMSWAELKEIRPGIIEDSHILREGLGAGRENSYWFAPLADQANARSEGHDGILVGVVMDQLIPQDSSLGYERRADSIRATWAERLGPPSVVRIHSIGPDSVPKRTEVWTAPGLLLVLETEPLSHMPMRVRLIRAAVMRSRAAHRVLAYDSLALSAAQ